MKEDIARIEERGGEKGGREGGVGEAGEGGRRGEVGGEGEGKEKGGRRRSQERDEMYGRDTYLFCTEPTSQCTSIIHTYFLAIWDSALHQ